MTIPVSLEPRVRLTWRRRITARTAVAAAWVIIRFPPMRIRRVLSLVSRGAASATEPQAAGARTAVVSVSVQCAGQGCLLRSVATALLCRLGGTWPSWCTGVRTEPFQAHAWVEVDGRPVAEPEGVSRFHKLMTVPPRR